VLVVGYAGYFRQPSIGGLVSGRLVDLNTFKQEIKTERELPEYVSVRAIHELLAQDS
jgi:hypothetical protein